MIKHSLALLSGLECKEHINDYSNILVITHEDSPGWLVTLTINSAKGAKNRLELNGKSIGVYNKVTMPKIVDRIEMLRRAYDQGVANTKITEAKAIEWMERQEKEIGHEPYPEWMDINIITSGLHTGAYRVSFEPGCPLEHLDVEQVKALIALCARIRSS